MATAPEAPSADHAVATSAVASSSFSYRSDSRGACCRCSTWRAASNLPAAARSASSNGRTSRVTRKWWHRPGAGASDLGRGTVILDQAIMQFGGQRVDRSSDLGVRLELEFLLVEVVVCLRLLKRSRPVLTNHDEG